MLFELLTPEARALLSVEIKRRNVEVGKKAQAELLEFFQPLVKEGEHSAIILGAERLNASLELLLEAMLLPTPKKKPGKSDPLIRTALGTFARKAEFAYRLGFIDSEVLEALNLIRDLRNDFAHATKVESLQKPEHALKIRALWKLISSENSGNLAVFTEIFGDDLPGKYLSCVTELLIKLELVRAHVTPPDVLLPAKLNYRA